MDVAMTTKCDEFVFIWAALLVYIPACNVYVAQSGPTRQQTSPKDNYGYLWIKFS